MSSEKQFFRKMAFGERLAQARTRLKLSQEALAEAVGTTARSISRWEHNQAIPQQYYRERLCEVLQTTAEALFAENDEKQQDVEKQAPLWYVPYPRNPYFTGREDILHRLHEQLHQEHQIALTQPQIMSGLGGIGKTQTALEYLYRFRDEYQTVLWVGAETPEILMSNYRVLAHLFQLPEKDSSDHILLREAIKRWFHSHTNWLLVFDNVEDMEPLHIMLPDARQGHMLITTRSQIVGTLGFHIDLQKMEPAEGVLFLLRRARLLHANAALEDAPPSLLAQANTLVELLDGLPLALDQAGAYIEETACTLSDYLERYATRRTVLLSTRGTLSNHHPDAVTTTLALAIQQVEQRSPAAADLLHVCAFLHAEAIPEEFFVQTGEALSVQLQSISDGPFLLDEAIRELRRFSLLHREAETKTLSIHRLLQAIIQDKMGKEEQKEWIKRITRAMLRVFPDYRDIAQNDVKEQSKYQPYFLHALKIIDEINKRDIRSEDASDFLYRVGMYLHLQGSPTQGLPLLHQAVHIAENIFGDEHEITLLYLKMLAMFYRDTKQIEESEACFQKVLLTYRKMNKPGHPDSIESLWNLVPLYTNRGLYTPAISLAKQALALSEQTFGLEHHQVALSLNMLAFAYVTKGDYKQAENLFLRAQYIFERTVGRDHLYMGSCLANLGYVYYIQGDYTEAARAYQQSLTIHEQKFGSISSRGSFIMNMLGATSFQQKQYHQAEIYYNKALEFFDDSSETDVFHTIYSLIGLAELHLVQDRKIRAQRALQRAVSLSGNSDQIDEVNYAVVAHFTSLLGNQLTSQGRVARAQIFYIRAEVMRKRISDG